MSILDRLFEHKTQGVLKGMTLEWSCPKCAGNNYKLLRQDTRKTGTYHTRCRYCKAKFELEFPDGDKIVPGENEFLKRLSLEDFTEEEDHELIKDFAEIVTLKAENTPRGYIGEKEKALEKKIAFLKIRRR
jgi:hypothetical protein